MKSRIVPLIKKHERLRSEGVNLVASENMLSPQVREALASDLAGRYHSAWYGGSRAARDIVEATEELACKLFRARHALVAPISGNLCDLAVLFAFTAYDEKVAMLPFSAGGYPLGLEKFHRRRVSLPVDERGFNVDGPSALEALARERPELTILGSSFILFPQPVAEIATAVKAARPPGFCVYDGSHVLGLIACGEFQDPLREGAEVLFGSTHKSFFGPQGGILLTNSAEHAARLRKYLEIDFETGIGLVDNPHMNRIAALGIAMEEMLANRGYGRRVIENAIFFGRALDKLGVPIRFREHKYTRSHQLLLDLDSARAEKLCRDLEAVSIFIDVGGRLGLAEATHRGMRRAELREIAEVIAEVYHGGPRPVLKKRIRDLVESGS
jgi:glycine hydroxymethyltransferase